jgi:hypothetical protein
MPSAASQRASSAAVVVAVVLAKHRDELAGMLARALHTDRGEGSRGGMGVR